MRVLITAGPTRTYIDPVRFITNASSGRMGYAVARRALAAGHDVTLLSGPVALAAPAGAKVAPFVTVRDLREALNVHFDTCDALVMAAAVGDFDVPQAQPSKLRRGEGPVTLELTPTPDLLEEVTRRRRREQTIIAFAVVDVEPEATARQKLLAKRADWIVVNSPAAMGAARSRAAILSADGLVLGWDERSKEELAQSIVELLERRP
jgi:phosphopantothenoylcysteine decarboxylase / phosphopantothenate---cysteine ligase